jgi:methylated-DNA-[protein]-cysteine S-methyltransferase
LTALIQRTRAWLDAYFQRRWHVLDALPVVLAGTPFQQRVWQHMVTIPLATTCCYGDMARRLGTAPRAVGQAVAANPLPIVIPCHRVVGKAGLTGYSGYGGTGTKAWLLAHEAGEREPTMARS